MTDPQKRLQQFIFGFDLGDLNATVTIDAMNYSEAERAMLSLRLVNPRLVNIFYKADDMTDAEKEDRIARAICAERCATYGDKPCYQICEWPNLNCENASHDAGCHTLARAALKAITEEGNET